MKAGRLLAFGVCLVVTNVLSVAAGAQEAARTAERALMTRAELDSLLRQHEQYSESGVYSAELRAQARLEADLVRQRLRDGDFQVGDRILLIMESPEARADTLTVRPGRVVEVTNVGQIQLSGVLRAELEDHLRKSVARYVRDPVLRATSHIRIAVLGEVTGPGFFVVPSEGLIGDVLMKAGGPRETADVSKLRVERNGKPIWSGKPLQDALAEGLTLDQLSVRAGDQFFVPKKSGGLGGAESAVRVVSLILSLPLAIFAVTQIF